LRMVADGVVSTDVLKPHLCRDTKLCVGYACNMEGAATTACSGYTREKVRVTSPPTFNKERFSRGRPSARALLAQFETCAQLAPSAKFVPVARPVSLAVSRSASRSTLPHPTIPTSHQTLAHHFNPSARECACSFPASLCRAGLATVWWR
jgi:hypothetical protein